MSATMAEYMRLLDRWALQAEEPCRCGDPELPFRTSPEFPCDSCWARRSVQRAKEESAKHDKPR